LKALSQRKASGFAEEQLGSFTSYVCGRKKKNPIAAMVGPELNTLCVRHGRVDDEDYFLAWHQISVKVKLRSASDAHSTM